MNDLVASQLVMVFVAVLEGIKELYENRPYFVLGNKVTLLFVTLDVTGKIAVFAVLHYDIDFLLLFIEIAVHIRNYVRVMHFLQSIALMD